MKFNIKKQSHVMIVHMIPMIEGIHFTIMNWLVMIVHMIAMTEGDPDQVRFFDKMALN